MLRLDDHHKLIRACLTRAGRIECDQALTEGRRLGIPDDEIVAEVLRAHIVLPAPVQQELQRVHEASGGSYYEWFLHGTCDPRVMARADQGYEKLLRLVVEVSKQRRCSIESAWTFVKLKLDPAPKKQRRKKSRQPAVAAPPAPLPPTDPAGDAKPALRPSNAQTDAPKPIPNVIAFGTGEPILLDGEVIDYRKGRDK